MGGAGVGVGTIFGHISQPRCAIPSAARPVRQSDLRLRGDGSARHFLAADRAAALVRFLSDSIERRYATLILEPAMHKERKQIETRSMFRRRSMAAAFRRSTKTPLPASALDTLAFVALYLLMSRVALPGIGSITRIAGSACE